MVKPIVASDLVFPLASTALTVGFLGYMYWRAQPHVGDIVGVPLSALPFALTPDLVALAQGGKAGLAVSGVTGNAVTGIPTALILPNGQITSFPGAPGAAVQIAKNQISGIYRNGTKIT